MTRPRKIPSDHGPYYELEIDDVKAILGHTHWIAFKNRAHIEFCNENYPGYSIRALMGFLEEQGAIVPSDTHFSGFEPSEDLTVFHIPVRGTVPPANQTP